MKKSPAFQFYPSDWLSSQRVSLMSLAEEGAYVRLLCYCWIHGSVPLDPVKAARLIGKGCQAETAKVVLDMFRADGARALHDRLEAELAKQVAYRETQSKAGKNGAKKRWGRHSEPNGVAIISPMAKNSSSIFSLQTTSTIQDRERVAGASFPKVEDVVKFGSTQVPPIPEDFCRAWFEELDGAGWIDRHHRPVSPQRWKQTLSAAARSMRHNQQERNARQKSYGKPNPRTAADRDTERTGIAGEAIPTKFL